MFGARFHIAGTWYRSKVAVRAYRFHVAGAWFKVLGFSYFAPGFSFQVWVLGSRYKAAGCRCSVICFR